MSQVESQQCLANIHASLGVKPSFSVNIWKNWGVFLLFALIFAFVLSGSAAADLTGLNAFHVRFPALNGSGIAIAHVEAGYPNFEVDPSTVGQPTSLFVYFNTNGTAVTGFPNSAGLASGHANAVGSIFYGKPDGVAPGVARVDNYDANSFYQHFIQGSVPITTKIVNQSFIFNALNAAENLAVESSYDTYSETFGVLFVSGLGNSGGVSPPGTAYNGIGVAAYGGASSIGPTSDGRSKPDITAPAGATSFSTPLVSGAAAVLLQAANSDLGGSGTSTAAGDIRTLKGLLLGGAVKPSDWTHTSSAPLDTRYGAGILNIYNSYSLLTAGKHPFIESTMVTSGASHPPGSNPANSTSSAGWDFNSISGTITQDKINHYYLNVTNDNASFSASLNWNRQSGQTKINDLDLFLYNLSTGQLVAASTSTVDNVELIHLALLPKGRYDLQVVKNGLTKRVTSSESYALTFQSVQTNLQVSKSDPSQVTVSWPLYPSGFVLESKAALEQSWSAVSDTPSVLGINYQLAIPANGPSAFYRLRNP